MSLFMDRPRGASRRRLPRYMLLAQSIMADIRSGKYPLGSRLPTESEFCAASGMSRHTVREALRILAEQALVSRRPGIGTTVIADRPARRYQPSISSVSELLQLARYTLQEITAVEDVVAEGDTRELLDCGPGERWRKVTLVRYAPSEDTALAYGEIYIPAEFEGVLSAAELGIAQPFQKPFHKLIEARYGRRASEVRQKISAVALLPEVAARLDAEPASPGLHLLRYFYDADHRLIELASSIFPGDRYSYSMRMRVDDSDAG